jgi:hypothetical protein
MAVPCKVTGFSTIEAWSFGAWLMWGFFLWLSDHHVGVHIAAEVLSVVIWCSGMRYVHWDLYIVISGAWCVGGVVCRSLLLLLLWSSLLVLLTVSPGSWLELISILTEGIIERSGVWESSPCSDKFYHLSSFCDINGFGFVLSVCGWEWGPYDFIQNAWGEAVKEEANGLFISNGVACLSYQLFEVRYVLINVREAHLASVEFEPRPLLYLGV